MEELLQEKSQSTADKEGKRKKNQQTLCSKIGKFSITMMATLCKANYRLI